MVTELQRYISAPDPGTAGTNRRRTSSYRSGPISKEQPLRAANVFVKRCDETVDDDEECVPLVLVS